MSRLRRGARKKPSTLGGRSEEKASSSTWCTHRCSSGELSAPVSAVSCRLFSPRVVPSPYQVVVRGGVVLLSLRTYHTLPAYLRRASHSVPYALYAAVTTLWAVYCVAPSGRPVFASLSPCIWHRACKRHDGTWGRRMCTRYRLPRTPPFLEALRRPHILAAMQFYRSSTFDHSTAKQSRETCLVYVPPTAVCPDILACAKKVTASVFFP